jgi:hypothetical protein
MLLAFDFIGREVDSGGLVGLYMYFITCLVVNCLTPPSQYE